MFARTRTDANYRAESPNQVDLGATVAGMLTALGVTALIGSVAAAAGVIGYERGYDVNELTTSGVAIGLVVLAIAFTTGGWVAARMAGYAGARHGFFAGAWVIVTAGALAAIGTMLADDYDVVQEVNLPAWLERLTNGADGVLAAVLLALVMLMAAAAGGVAGARDAHMVDDTRYAPAFIERRAPRRRRYREEAAPIS
jgi:hypothetical protein